MKKPALALITLATVCLGGLATKAHGYGVLRWLFEEKYSDAYLTRLVIEKRPINYCLEIDSSVPLRDSSINAQIQLAISQYRAVLNEGAGRSSINRVRCDHPNLNLLVRIGPDYENRKPQAYHFPVVESGGRKYSKISLNTISPYATHAHFRVHADTLELIRGDINKLKSGIGKIGDLNGAQPYSFNARFGLRSDVQRAEMKGSTWVTILHEVGHAFGLCDTYSQEHFETQAHEHYRTAIVGLVGVMSETGYVNLAPDDVQGLKAARQGLREWQRSTGRR